MSILWCGGEDVDFPNGLGGCGASTTAGWFRSNYCRCGVRSNSGNFNYSNPFPGGGVTSLWLRVCVALNTWNTGSNYNQKIIGLVQQSTGVKGLWLGTGSTGLRMAVYTFDGTNAVRLAESTSDIWPNSALGFHVVDLNVVGYGSSALITVYQEGLIVIPPFYADIRVAGVTNFDGVCLGTYIGNEMRCSEIIVADEDTRPFPGLMTLALTGAGTTGAWTSNTFSNINGIAISDASPAYSNTNAQDQQYNVTDLLAGVYSVKAVKISARAAVSAGAVSKVSLGYNNAGTVGFGAGAQKSPTTVYSTFEQLDTTDPTNGGGAWTQAEMNGLQVDLRSAT